MRWELYFLSAGFFLWVGKERIIFMRFFYNEAVRKVVTEEELLLNLCSDYSADDYSACYQRIKRHLDKNAKNDLCNPRRNWLGISWFYRSIYLDYGCQGSQGNR